MSQSHTAASSIHRALAWIGPSDQIVPNIFAGLITGLVSVIYSVSYAILIFSGPLADFFPVGINITLISATVLGLLVVCNSSYQFAVGGPDSDAVAILGFMTSIIALALVTSGATTSLLATVVVFLGLTTLSAGLALFVAGKLRLGRWIRFVPYPIIGGILASSGWFFTRGAFTVMTGTPLRLNQLGFFMQPDILIDWLPGLLFALVLLVIMRHYTHFLLIPGLVVGAVAIFYLLLWLGGFTLAEAVERNWLFKPFAETQFWWSQPELSLARVDWLVLVGQAGSLIALSGLFVMITLLNASAIELATDLEADLDQELRSAGVANIVTGLCGGIMGGLSISRTLLNHRAGGTSRLSGLTVALFCSIILLVGTPWLSYIPRAVLGGLLFYIGLSLLIRWLYQTWFQLKLKDYLLIWAIVLTITTIGFLEGIGMGVVIACVIFTVTYSRSNVIKHQLTGAEQQSNRARPIQQQQLLQTQGRAIHIIWLQGYLFFGTAAVLLDHIRRDLETDQTPKIRWLVLNFQWVSGLDISAIHSFVRLGRLAKTHQVELIFTNLLDDLAEQFKQNQIINNGETSQIFPDLDRALEGCEHQILSQGALRRDRPVPLALQLSQMFLTLSQVPHFMRYLEAREVPANQILIAKGSHPEAIYFVEHGQVTVIDEFEDGRIRRIQTMGSGAIFGELGLYRHTPALASVVTDRTSRIYRLSGQLLDQMQEKDPALAAAFHQFMARLVAERLAIATRTINLLLH